MAKERITSAEYANPDSVPSPSSVSDREMNQEGAEAIELITEGMGPPSRRSPSYRSKRSWWMRLRYFGRSALKRLPLLGPLVIGAWRFGKYLFLTIQWRVLAIVGTLRGTYATDLDVDRIAWISPRAIQYCTLQAFNLVSTRGRVIGGDWDRLEKRFEHLDIYVALRQVCLEGKSWEETVYYRRVLDKLSAGQIVWGCRTKSEFDQRCKERERLYHAIKSEGYQSQRERARSQNWFDPLGRSETEVAVSIGRHGDLLFSDGAHRLAIAKLLGVTKIPVEIAVRHPGWLGRRRELLRQAEEMDESDSRGVTHPDLIEVSACSRGEDTFAAIGQSMVAKGGHLLDLGGDRGYFYARFEDEGFDCVAIGVETNHLRFLSEVARVEHRSSRIFVESALDWPGIREMSFDVVLALKVFHKYLETKATYDRFIALLEDLRAQELFFEPSGEPPKAEAFASFDPEEFVEFLLTNSHLESAESIGLGTDGSPLYRLYRRGEP